MQSLRAVITLIFILATYNFSMHGQTTPAPQRNYPAPVEGDYVIKDFKFRSGETLPELKLHYRTIGTPTKDSSGVVTNAILIMHGTGGSGTQFLSPQFANVLFGPGQLLDATKYFIILPDAIGHGGSSKPSDGLHTRFPHYTYDDMVLAQYKVITEKLGVNHLRLVMGTSMGGMHTWVWGETYPDFMDALMPLACAPVEIAGRNRIMRRMIMEAIRNDPAWNNGEYKTQPVQGLTAAENILLLMGSAALPWHKEGATRDAADMFYDNRVKAGIARTDANNMLYYFDSSRDYNPSPHLESIKVPLFAINSADDLINPPELGILEREIKRLKQGRYILLPITDQTRGHGTHTIASIWQGYLKELLELTMKK
jgi:homoserine O-acetyltransferase/O-succinyltransferase